MVGIAGGKEFFLIGDPQHHIGVAVCVGEKRVHILHIHMGLCQDAQQFGQAGGTVQSPVANFNPLLRAADTPAFFCFIIFIRLSDDAYV